jgi:hypothetical protein
MQTDLMQTDCSADLFGCAPVAGRAVVAGFDGGKMTYDTETLLLGATNRAVPVGRAICRSRSNATSRPSCAID